MAEKEVASPCINVCRLDPEIRLCTGCFRTEQEIVDWTRYSADEKRAVIANLPARKAVHGKPARLARD